MRRCGQDSKVALTNSRSYNYIMTDKEIVAAIIEHAYLIVMHSEDAYEVTDSSGELEPREALVDSLQTYIKSQEE